MTPSVTQSSAGNWRREMTRHHWWVLTVAALAWSFDTMDQRIFILARGPAMSALLPQGTAGAELTYYSGVATAIFMLGWAVGGFYFGILGDRWGRAKTMMITILSYTVFTGLSVLSTGVWDFNMYRFLCGLGVGGQFAVGVALVAETMPDRARPLQALQFVGPENLRDQPHIAMELEGGAGSFAGDDTGAFLATMLQRV